MAVKDAPTNLRGSVYGVEFGDLFIDLMEHVPDLLFPLSVRTFHQMRNDPQLRGILAGYTHPVRKAEWTVDPAGCRDEVVQLVADDLGIGVKGTDTEPGAARRRGVNWRKHLELAAPGHLIYGFYPFEKRFDIVAGQARLVELSERVPASVTDLQVNKDGSLKGIRQSGMLKPDDLITADRLVWYSHEMEGANWFGRSLLRYAYGPWLLKHEMWRVHGTSIRRFGMGVPTVEAPPGATQGQITEAQRLASKIGAGQSSGAGMPNGFTYKLAGLTGSVPDALGFIRYLDQQMSTGALAGILDLGSTDNGSRALGDVFVGLLEYAQQSDGDTLAEEATRALSVPLTDYNFGEDEPAPRIVCGDVAADRDVTAEALQLLLTSGALSSDPNLEADVRRRWGLPERDPNAPAPPPMPTPAPPNARSGRPPKGVAAQQPQAALRRQPSNLETAAKTDFTALQEEWETALDRLIRKWGPISDAQIGELVDQVEAIVTAGAVTDLNDMSVTVDEATELLEQAMRDVADEAAQRQADEGLDQGVTVAPGDPNTERLGEFAETIANLAASGLVASAARKALQVWTPNSAAADVANQVRDHLESLTDAALRDNLGAGLSAGQNEGRVATLRTAPPADRYAASEILDANSCQACRDVDGFIYDDLSDAEAAYANGGYVGCLGGLRCRGIIVTLWDASALPAAA